MNNPIYQLVLIAVLSLPCIIARADEDYVAGIAPDARPAHAPMQTQYGKSKEWYCRALTGIAQPYPNSLRFLDDQGGWYSPFIVAGMTGPYDIRNWHGTALCGRR